MKSEDWTERRYILHGVGWNHKERRAIKSQAISGFHTLHAAELAMESARRTSAVCAHQSTYEIEDTTGRRS